jgi:hypothetical protein
MFASLLIIHGSYQKLYAHTIVKNYRLVIIEMEVLSLPSNMKYKSSACMYAHHILPTHHCNKMADNDVSFCQHTVSEFNTKKDN